MSSATPDLLTIALNEMQAAGFDPALPPAVQAEMAHLPDLETLVGPEVTDLRALLWSSIDNADSQDLDQIEVAVPAADGQLRLLVGIADVAAWVAPDSATDRFAAASTTSVYPGVTVFPMLPPELSTDRTSLLQDVDRLAVVTELLVSPEGEISATRVFSALVRNYARLDYPSVGAWLEGQAGPPPSIADRPALLEQLRLQETVAQRLSDLRQRRGALEFASVEAQPVIEAGQVQRLVVVEKNRARWLVETLMVAANMALADFMLRSARASIVRVVRAPERWERIAAVAAEYHVTLPAAPDAPALAAFLKQRRAADPLHFPDLSLRIVKLLGGGDYTVVQPGDERLGHFGLAAAQYTHSTAPNRRYVDLVIQRLVKAALADAPPPYTLEELEALAAHCNKRESAARSVERRMRKHAAVALLSDQIGQQFAALVTGVSAKGTFVRVLEPPLEGRLVAGDAGLEIGDALTVRLITTDPERGFIDFERVVAASAAV